MHYNTAVEIFNKTNNLYKIGYLLLNNCRWRK
jgi:uncharacterized membrane protein